MSKQSKLTPREERGLIIAALCKLSRNDAGLWLVPSQSADGKQYVVNLEAQTCSCPDHQETGVRCKHQLAVSFTLKRELNADGSVSETRSVTFAERVTYGQDWQAYDRAQTTEKHRFQVLLADLCSRVPQPPRKRGRGRNAILLSDAVFAVAFKVYCGLSARRFACDLLDAHERGHVTRPLHYNKLVYLTENPLLTPIFKSLIVQSSLPLRAVETTFAPDSTGFSVSRFVRWFDEKYGAERSGRDWVKAHAICGVNTHIVTAVEIAGRDANDSPHFQSLVARTAQSGFDVQEVAADKAYLSEANLEQVASLGGTAFVPFKVNSVGDRHEKGGVWEKMFGYYTYRRDEFLAHYHQRSNIESVFSSLKRKFGDSVRSRTDVAMVNEVLAKFLCHNIVSVIHSQEELGIEPAFWPEDGTPRDVLQLPAGR